MTYTIRVVKNCIKFRMTIRYAIFNWEHVWAVQAFQPCKAFQEVEHAPTIYTFSLFSFSFSFFNFNIYKSNGNRGTTVILTNCPLRHLEDWVYLKENDLEEERESLAAAHAAELQSLLTQLKLQLKKTLYETKDANDPLLILVQTKIWYLCLLTCEKIEAPEDHLPQLLSNPNGISYQLRKVKHSLCAELSQIYQRVLSIVL